MFIVKPGIRYKLNYFGDKERFVLINFTEKVHQKIALEEPITKEIYVDGVVKHIDGITNEEVLYMMLDRFKYLNDRHFSKYNEIAIQGIKQAIGAMKDRKKIKQENKKRYEESFQTEVKEFKESE